MPSGLTEVLAFVWACHSAASSPREIQPEVQMGESLMVDVGGHRLHAIRKGKGRPAVVFESGWGSEIRTWEYVFATVAEFTTVVAYSRAGNGDSEAGPLPRTPERIAEDLHILLRQMNIEPPYVLVGHSLGGLYIRVFAALHPEEVSGLVFIDAMHERLFKEFERLDPDGWVRTLEIQDQMIARQSKQLQSEVLEYRNVQAAGALSKAPSLTDIPVIVLTSVKPDESQWVRNTPEGMKVWQQLQAEWSTSSSKGRQIVTDRSGI